MSERITITQSPTPGLYGTDAAGRRWSSVSTTQPVPCAQCGAPVTRGYRTGDTWVCLEHVDWQAGETA